MKRAASKGNVSRQKPLVSTKLRPPSNRGALIERPHLLATLRETLARKLALIHGPAGFGKTTLATQWYAELRAAGAATAWLAMDSSDNDLNRFLSYLVEAVRSAVPEMGEGLQDVIEANPGSAADFVLDSLVNDFSVHGDPFVLFLDDWHLVREADVHETLQLLLTRSPPNLHVVITSRTRAGVPLTRLRVQNELVEIDATRLRFDFEESKTYLTGVKSLALPQEDLLALWRSTEGWAAALQLASLSLREAGDHERILHWTSGASNDIGEYLAENVLDNLPASEVRFLLKTSILDRLSADLCSAITGEKDSAARLEALERQELFLLPIDEERQWFRYHHLFARFLQRRLQKQMPQEVARLHLAASEWFAAHGQTAEAVEHALAANAVSRAVDLVERDAMSLVEHSHMSTLLSLVRKLPRTALFDRPHLQIAIAWANCLTHHPQETTEALWHVERVASAATPAKKALLLGEARVVRACSQVYGDQLQGVETMVQPCLDRAQAFSPWAVGVAANIMAYRHIQACEFDKVSPLLRWARDYQDLSEGLFSSVYGRCFDGIAARNQGRLDVAKRLFTEALDVATRAAGRQSNAARLAGALLGQILYEENDLDHAERLLRESRSLGVEGGAVDFYIATYVCSSRLMMQRGKPDEALAILQEAEDTARTLSLDRLSVAVACERIRIRLEAGDVRGAERILGDIDSRRETTSTPGPAPLRPETLTEIAMAKARVLSARGNAGLAVQLLQEQIDATHHSGRTLQELCLRIVLAVTLDAEGRTSEAEPLLLATLEDAVPRGMVRAFLDEGAPLVNLLERLREQARRRRGGEELPSRSAAADTPLHKLLHHARHAEQGVRVARGTRIGAADLTARESEVVRLLDQGLSNKEIARALSISVDTVKWFLKNIFVKLGVSTRAQAVAEMRRRDPGSGS